MEESINIPRLLELIKEVEERDKEYERLAREHKVATEAGRLSLIASNPGLEEYLEFVRARQSIIDARDSAPRNEGHLYII